MRNFVYVTMVPSPQHPPLVPHHSSRPYLFKRIWLYHAVGYTTRVATPGHRDELLAHVRVRIEKDEPRARGGIGGGREPFVLNRSAAEDGGGNVTLAFSNNGLETGCSIGCTTWQPAACAQFGTCETAAEESPVGQDLPGKREVGSTVLPAWVTIADAERTVPRASWPPRQRTAATASSCASAARGT